jgi:uncharacterized membrane protein (UPF0127 family)
MHRCVYTNTLLLYKKTQKATFLFTFTYAYLVLPFLHSKMEIKHSVYIAVMI